MNSVALMIVLLREELPFDEAVFADTGGEVPETYEYLTTAKEYLARHDVPLTIVSKRAAPSTKHLGSDVYSRRRSGDGRLGTTRSHRSSSLQVTGFSHQPVS